MINIIKVIIVIAKAITIIEKRESLRLHSIQKGIVMSTYTKYLVRPFCSDSIMLFSVFIEQYFRQ